MLAGAERDGAGPGAGVAGDGDGGGADTAGVTQGLKDRLEQDRLEQDRLEHDRLEHGSVPQDTSATASADSGGGAAGETSFATADGRGDVGGEEGACKQEETSSQDHQPASSMQHEQVQQKPSEAASEPSHRRRGIGGGVGGGSGSAASFQVTAYFAKQFDALRRKCCSPFPPATATASSGQQKAVADTGEGAAGSAGAAGAAGAGAAGEGVVDGSGDVEFVRSLCRCKRWSAEGGKSSVYFAKTADDRFVIKQEILAFLDFANDYFKHLFDAIESSNPSCLAKILGLYQVGSDNIALCFLLSALPFPFLSPLCTLLSALSSLHSPLCTLLSALSSLHSPLCTLPPLPLCTLLSALSSLHSLSTLHSPLCTLLSALSSLHSPLCTLLSALSSLHSPLCTLLSALSSLHSPLCTLLSALSSLHSPLCTLLSALSSLHSPLCTLLSALSSLHSPLCTLLSALSSLHSPLCTLLSALSSLHSPLCTLLSALSSLHSPLCTLLSALSSLHSPLCTLSLSALSSLLSPLSSLLAPLSYLCPITFHPVHACVSSILTSTPLFPRLFPILFPPPLFSSPQVLLDENLLEAMPTSPIFVGKRSKQLLERAVWNDTAFLAKHAIMDYSLLVGVEEERSTLVVGIIDFIRPYTWDKQLETWVKASGLLGGGGAGKDSTPTVISPSNYKKRFRKAMQTYFVMVPDQWVPRVPEIATTAAVSAGDCHHNCWCGRACCAAV
ncbi:unnamed protein product [Closterium sp. Yama58-4]|nr:unnamed protein product [Closterium sp. Yama58-4]